MRWLELVLVFALSFVIVAAIIFAVYGICYLGGWEWTSRIVVIGHCVVEQHKTTFGHWTTTGKACR